MSALTDRDSNIAATSNPQGKQTGMGEENQPQDAQQHRDVLEQKSNGNNDKYVSPSDSILSPASQKLTSFKQRQINKSSGKNPAARTLFARTPSAASSGFDDVEATQKKE